MSRAEVGECIASAAPIDRSTSALDCETEFEDASRRSGSLGATESTVRLSVGELRPHCMEAKSDSRTAPPFAAKLRGGLRVSNRFLLEERLGKGAMGEVWKARDLDLATPVAIKFLIPLASRAEGVAALERFTFEARVSAQLGRRTRGIVLVYDIGTCEHGPYLVMEDLGRTTLSARLARGALTVAEVAHVVDRVADALGTAHELGIVHRDVKPSNLFLVDEGGDLPRLAIADFGIAKAISEHLAHVAPAAERDRGLVMGSLAYMAPEQLAAEPVDARADVYALGVVTYELLTRELPLRGIPPAESVALARFSRDIRAWFDQALAEDRTKRFSTAPQMARALRAAIAAPRRRARWQAMGVLAIAVALVTGAAAHANAGRATVAAAIAPLKPDRAALTPSRSIATANDPGSRAKGPGCRADVSDTR